MNYFELFDIKPSPYVDKQKVAVKYFQMQRETHPDFFMHATEAEKAEALQRSSWANEGYAIFNNQQKTMEHYLQVTDVITEGEKYQLSPDFLMEMMELNDSLDEKGNEVAKHEILDIQKAIELPVKKYLNGTDNPDEKGMLELKEYYYQKKYLDRILERLGD